MQYSIVNFKDLSGSIRIDAECYKPYYLTIENLIKKYKNDYIFNLIEKFNSGKNLHQTSDGIRFLRTQNIKSITISDDGVSFTNSNMDLLKVGDLIITRVGEGVGNISIVSKYFSNCAYSDNVIRIRFKKTINPIYVCVFLQTKFGKYLIERFSKGTARSLISKESFEEIKIPILSESFQKKISDMVNEAFDLQQKAKADYAMAKDILETELGIKNWTPENSKTNIKTLNEVKSVGATFRLDSEFFQPKYEDIINKIKSYKNGFKKLSEIVDIKKSIEVGSFAYTESGIPYIRISNLTEMGFNYGNCNYISNKYYEELKLEYQPKKNDILFSKDGTVGIAYKYNSNEDITLSGGILRLYNSSMNENILTLLLNSMITKHQTERLTCGALISHLSIDNVKSLLIPSIPDAVQKKISILIEASFGAKDRSKQLLNIAKSVVEIAIEQNEQAAEKYVKENL